jgi:hypothetical protein
VFLEYSTFVWEFIVTQEYLRQFSCVVANASGEGLEFNQFKVQFTIRRGDFQTPNSCDVRIFNLSDKTANMIGQNEYTQLAISAGYEGNFALIFRGTIKQFRLGRINQLDSYVDITAADGDEAYNFAPVIQSVPAGNNQASLADVLFGAISKNFPITKGYLPNLPSNQLIRGRVMYGLCRDEYRDFAWTNNCKWSIQDGAVTMIPYTSYIANTGEVPIISVSTGLIGVPEQTQQGISIRTLLNPNYKIGQLVQLTAGVNTFRRSLDLKSLVPNQLTAEQVQTSADGLYYIMIANHSGDTRGTDWYTTMTCLSVDSTITSNHALNALIAGSAESIQRYGQ